MKHEASTLDIILNIAAQLFNIALFFFVVIKFMGKSITTWIVARMEKEKKLAMADETYGTIIAEAEKKAAAILHDATGHKDNLIRQWELAAKQKQQAILDEAERKAKSILDTADKQATLAQADLEKNFVTAVQGASRTLIKKIFAKKDMQESYTDSLIDEFTDTTKTAF